jgi:hypothetical protein
MSYTHPKRTTDQVNIWYAPKSGEWITCALIPQQLDHYFTREVVYKKERVAHPSFELAVAYINDNYVGGTK